MTCGNIVSSTSTSLEKRASTRPLGVLSKNCNGARIIPESMILCIAIAAERKPKCGMTSVKKHSTAVQIKMNTYNSSNSDENMQKYALYILKS